MINKQCVNCAKKGKNFYCRTCDITSEFFDIYSYYKNRMSENLLIGRMKAFTWHDVLEYIKYNFFHDVSVGLNINCEKHFAYIEKKLSDQVISNYHTDTADSEGPIGYKIYLNKNNKSVEGPSKIGDFWDLTLKPVTHHKYS